MNNVKDFINYINDTLNGDFDHDLEVFYKKIIPNDRELTIDEAIDIMISCPNLERILGKLKKQKVVISNSALYSAYKALHDKPLSKDTKFDMEVEDKPFDDEDEIYEEDDEDDELNIEEYFKFQKDIDCFRLYLNEIGRYPLLSIEEIKNIYKKIEAINDKKSEIKKRTDLNEEDKRLLIVDAEEAIRELREKVVKHNLRLVVSIAKRYNGRGVSLRDIIQDGNFGLMRAAEKYNYKLGYCFSTYAFWWIRQAASRCIDDTGLTIRIPVHANEVINSMRKFIDAEIIDKGEKPDDSVLKEKYKLSDKSLELYKNVYNRNYIISLSSPVRTLDGSKSTLQDFIADDTDVIEDKTNDIAYEDLKDDIEYNFNLTVREAKVLKLRYGLEDGKRRTLEEVGKMMGVTRERIRQIEVKAIKKLRKSVKFKAKYAPEEVFNPYTLVPKKK